MDSTQQNNDDISKSQTSNFIDFGDNPPSDKDEKYPMALPKGTVLAGQYVIDEPLGQGGFGITYSAIDHKDGKKVAIKEYFPDSLVTRTEGVTVKPLSGNRQESFEYGKEGFLEEAKTLSHFIGNENIIRVYTYFEENGTAYFAMEYVDGICLADHIKQNGGSLHYNEAAKILFPIMDALGAVHEKGIVHRDIAPDNIYITKEGKVKLLDFGAARYSMGDRSLSLDVILKHGFAPKEQYSRRSKQGPFTDVYALAATFYFAICGKRPPDSVDRSDEDSMINPSALGADIPAYSEHALLKALCVQPADRYQSMLEFKMALIRAMEKDTSNPTVSYLEVSNETQTANNTSELSNLDNKRTGVSSEVHSTFVKENYNKDNSDQKMNDTTKKYRIVLCTLMALVLVMGGILISVILAHKNPGDNDLDSESMNQVDNAKPVDQTEISSGNSNSEYYITYEISAPTKGDVVTAPTEEHVKYDSSEIHEGIVDVNTEYGTYRFGVLSAEIIRKSDNTDYYKVSWMFENVDFDSGEGYCYISADDLRVKDSDKYLLSSYYWSDECINTDKAAYKGEKVVVSYLWIVQNLDSEYLDVTFEDRGITCRVYIQKDELSKDEAGDYDENNGGISARYQDKIRCSKGVEFSVTNAYISKSANNREIQLYVEMMLDNTGKASDSATVMFRCYVYDENDKAIHSKILYVNNISKDRIGGQYIASARIFTSEVDFEKIAYIMVSDY